MPQRTAARAEPARPEGRRRRVGALEPRRERALVVRPRPRADERLAGLAALEEDDARDREDVVARGRRGVLVDVQLRELDATPVLGRKLLEHRMDGAARAAPRRPEVDDDGLLRSED